MLCGPCLEQRGLGLALGSLETTSLSHMLSHTHSHVQMHRHKYTHAVYMSTRLYIVCAQTCRNAREDMYTQQTHRCRYTHPRTRPQTAGVA